MDNPINLLPLPAELDNPFFFSTKIIKVDNNPSKPVTKNFICDVLFYNGIDSFKPWENQTDAIPLLIEEWGRDKKLLEELHRSRNQKDILVIMKKGISLFVQFLFWTNDRPVSLKEPIPFYPVAYKPVNIEERLAFIISRPNLFHSFRQLSELMLEQEKLFVKKNIMKKTSRPSG
jgi:hypothetical protein